MSRNDRWRAVIAPWAAVVLIALGVVGYGYYRPGDATDLIFYAATVHQWEGMEPAEVRDAAFADGREHFGPEVFERLVSNDFMRAVQADPEAVVQQIPFYSVKPAFPALMAVLGVLGLPLGTAALLISLASYFGFILLVFAWLTRHLRAWPAVGVTGLLAISFPWWLVSRLQTPDSLGLALGIAALFVLLELRRVNLGLALMLVTIGVRPNTVVMLATIAVCLALLKAPHPLRLSWPIAAAWVIAGAVVTEALILWSGDYGSGTLFYHSMVAFLPYPAEGPPPLSLEDIVRIYAYQLANIGRSPIPYFVLAAVLGIRLRMSVAGAVRADAAAMVLLALILAIGGEYMIAPREPERILAMPFAAIAVIVAYSVFDLAGRRLAAAD